MAVGSSSSESSTGLFSALFYEIFTSPLNIFLFAVITIVVYKILKSRQNQYVSRVVEDELPKMKKRDFTFEDLKNYNGLGPDGRILVAVNGKVFDVTRGKHFYGPGGPYAEFAGSDASRGLATFSVTHRENYDDLSDLSPMEMESIKEWEIQFTERYDYIGKLLKPGQEPTNYSDEEDDTSQVEPSERSKDD